MKNFRFQIENRVFQIVCERRGKLLIVRHGQDQVELVPEFKGDHQVNLREGTNREVAWVGRAGEVIHVVLDGETYRIHPLRFTGKPVSEPGMAAARLEAGTHPVKAPLPGSVVRLPVRTGQSVEAGQPLVFLEAMKMEHAVSAPADCLVGRIHVSESDRVALGDVLLEISVE